MAKVKATEQEEVINSDLIIEDWFKQYFSNVYGMSMEMYNNFYKAKEDLKTKIKG